MVPVIDNKELMDRAMQDLLEKISHFSNTLYAKERKPKQIKTESGAPTLPSGSLFQLKAENKIVILPETNK
jgi:hypothetical protein